MQRSCRAGGSFRTWEAALTPSTSRPQCSVSTQRQPRRKPRATAPAAGAPGGAQQPCSALTLHVVLHTVSRTAFLSGRNARQQSRALGLWCQKHSWEPWGSSRGPHRRSPFIATSSCCDDESEAWSLAPPPTASWDPQTPGVRQHVHQDHLIPESQGHWLEKTLPLPGSHPLPC